MTISIPQGAQRIVVVGTCGSGKTTLARQLAEIVHVPHVEMDALFWDANWTQAPVPLFRERVAKALSGPTWTTDGNYSKVRDLTWGAADTIIWLDYSLWIILFRVVKRTFKRIVTRTELWNGNRENFFNGVLTRDSIILWALQSYKRNRIRYSEMMQHPDYAHLHFVRLTSPQATREWLARFEREQQALAQSERNEAV